MKFVLLTRKRAITILFCFFALILALTFGVRAINSVSASSAKRLVPIYNVKTDEKKIAISFDAAWGNEQTQELIDILAKYKIKTTFFVVGNWAEKYPESVKALVDAGHEVCNHSDTHPHMPQLSRDEMVKQLQSCNEKVKAITGVSPVLFRPPYGDYSNALIEATDSIHMYTIQWDVDSLDWKDPTPQQMFERVTKRVKPGSIVLFHNGAKNTPAALPPILEKLQGDGYSIVPVSELILKDNYSIDSAGMQVAG